jgi:hypothetical protein
MYIFFVHTEAFFLRAMLYRTYVFYRQSPKIRHFIQLYSNYSSSQKNTLTLSSKFLCVKSCSFFITLIIEQLRGASETAHKSES